MNSSITLAERIRSKSSKPVEECEKAGSTRAKGLVYDRYQYCPRKDISRVTRRPPLQTPQNGKAFVIIRREPGEDSIPRYLVRQIVKLPQRTGELNGTTTVPSGTASAAPSFSASQSSTSSILSDHDNGKLPLQNYVGPIFRVCLHDIHRWVSLCAIEAFENHRFQQNEPDYFSLATWMRAKRRSERHVAAKAVVVTSAPPAFVKSPYVEVVVYNRKRDRDVYYDDITDLPESKKAKRGRPRKETLKELEVRIPSSSPSVADSNPPETPRSHRYSMIARALAPEIADHEASGNGAEDEEEWEVDQIVKHKDVGGVRHYCVAWAGVDETTWLTADDLGGAEDSLLEYLRQLTPEERLKEEQLMLDLPEFDIDAGDLEVADSQIASSQVGEDEIAVEGGGGSTLKFKRFKDIG